jgi:ligand-binding sensor domain-containing protein
MILLHFLGLQMFAQDYVFKRYTTSDGLVNEVILQIMQDSNGFLWISTASGISRFDGTHFKNYGYTEGLQGLIVYKIFEDKNHRLWIGTSKGIARLEGSLFIQYSNTGPGESIVFNFGEFSQYGLVAFSETGMYKLEDENKWSKINVLPEYNRSNCIEMIEADSGVYMNYKNAIIFKRPDFAARVLIEDNFVGAENLCNGIQVKNKRVYAGVKNKLYEITNGEITLLIDSIPINKFYNFTVEPNGDIWINSSQKGLFRYQFSGKLTRNVSSYRYDSNTSGFPFIDDQGHLWITSYEGLVRTSVKVYEDFTPARKAPSSKRFSVFPGSGEEVIVSDAFGLHVLKDRELLTLQRPPSYANEKRYTEDIAEGFARDSRRYTWIVTRQRKMLCWTGSQLLDYSPLLPRRSEDYIRNLAVNPVNNTVFMCDDSTLISGNEMQFTAFKDVAGNIFPKTTSVLFTQDGIGIVNVFSKGIYFITRDNRIVKAPYQLDIIDKGSFTYFFEDPDGWIWISNAGKGLVRFRINRSNYSVTDISKLTTEHGLPSNRIVYMAFDSKQNTWVSCSNGIVVLRKNDLDSSSWDTYPIGDEQNIAIKPPSSIIADGLGNVWLASLNQLTKIDVNKLVLKKVVPRVVIERVLLNMKATDWSVFSDSVQGYLQLPAQLNLAHHQNVLGIEFTGVSMYNAETFEYSYKLQPIDTAWSAPTTNKFISLVKLLPGTYSFQVKSRGKGTGWSDPKKFEFTIRPPFWETWWFRSLVIIIAASIIIAVYRTRVKKIHQDAHMRNQMLELEMKALKAQMNPHFIYNALNSIQSLIADNRKSPAINYIGKFSRLLRQILDYSENNVITLEKELQALVLYIQLESLRLNMDLEYTFTTADDLITENEMLPPLILQPFVENALWHGLSRKEGAKRLTIHMSQESFYLLCTVTDNGVGRANAALHKGGIYPSKGIDITLKRLVNHNRRVESPVEYVDLIDEEGRPAGTKVIIRISRW